MKNVILLLLMSMPLAILAQMSSGSYSASDNGSATHGGFNSTGNYQNFTTNTWYDNQTLQSGSYQSYLSMPSGFIYVLCSDIGITANGPTTFCPGDSVEIVTNESFVDYQWSNGASTPSITVNLSDSYHVVVVDSSGCIAGSDSILVNVLVQPTPTITLAGGATLTTEAAIDYQWFLDGNLITGATSQSFSPTVSGNYSVDVQDSTGCGITSSAIYDYDITGINDIESSASVQLYPNPVSDQLTVLGSFGSTKLLTLSITSIMGEHIFKTSITVENDLIRETIDVSDLQGGYYFLVIQDDTKNVVVSKFTKVN